MVTWSNFDKPNSIQSTHIEKPIVANKPPIYHSDPTYSGVGREDSGVNVIPSREGATKGISTFDLIEYFSYGNNTNRERLTIDGCENLSHYKLL